MLAINIAIKGLVKLWDTVNETVEEQEQKISELSSSIETLQSEYDELFQKQDITDAEKRRLEYLERRLELDKRILKAEQAQLFDEKTGNKFTDLFDKDNLHTQYLKEMNFRNKGSMADLNLEYNYQMNNLDNIHEQIAKLKELQATVEEGSNQWQYYQNSIDAALNQETKYIDKLSESESQLTINLGKYADNIEFLQSQLDTGKLTKDQTTTAKEQLKVWQNLYDETDAMITQIQKLNGTYDDTADRVARKYNAELNKAKTYLGGYDYSNTGASSTNETGMQISDFWNENVLSGTEEEISQNVELWEKVTAGIGDATKAMDAYAEAKKNANAETLSDDIALTIPTISSSVQQLATQLEPQFAKLGEAYKAIFTDNGFTLDDVDNSMLEDLRKSFAEIEEEIGVAFDASTLDPFFDTLTDSSSTADQVQQAFNDLATAYFYSTDTLEQLNEETAEAIAKQLEEMGVVNAEEVVMQALAEAKARAFLASYDLVDATEADITAMLNEAESAGITSDMIFKLVAQEQVFNAQGLSTEGKVAQLKELASAYGQTAVAAKIASMEGEYTKSHQPINYEEIAKAAQAEINSAINNVHVDFKGIGGGKSSAKSAGKDAGKSYKEGLEEELSDLNDVIGYIGDTINNQIDLFNDQKDAAVDALKAEKEAAENALEAEKALVQEKIDAKQKEIDAIKDAAAARKNEIDLQKAQYDLERMQQQRTILQYSEDKGMHYVTDTKEIRQAKEAVTEAKENIQIANLEKEISALNDIIDDIEKKIEASNKYYDDLISQAENYWNSLIKGLEDYKSRWNELKEIEEQAKMEVALKNLGIATDDILNMSDATFQAFKEKYLGVLKEMYAGNDDMILMLQQFGGISTEILSPLSGTIGEVSDSLNNFSNAISNVGTGVSSVVEPMGTAAEKVQSVTTALNNLSNDVSNYQMPSINTDNFTSAFTEDGGILSALNGFMERYKDICDGIPEIWNSSLAEAFGQGGGNGDPLAGGLANDTKYDALFSPMLDALENCKSIMESKLKECLGIFTSFQTDLSGVIGVGGGDPEDYGTSKSGGTGSKGKGSGGEKQSKSGDGSDTIVGAIQEGGKLIDEALNGDTESWSASFSTAQESIHNSATSIVECIESMVETVVNACIKAIEAINMLASADDNNPNNAMPSSYGKVGHNHGQVGNAHAKGVGGTKTDEKNAIVSEYGQREMTVFPNGKTVITDSPTAMDMPKGTVVYNEEQTEKILKNKVTETGNAYADGTDDEGWITLSDGTKARPLQPGDRMYDMVQKVNAYLESIDYNLEKLTPNSFYERNREMNKMADQISYVSSITNNNRNVQQPIYNEINVTLPNVTNSTSAESLLKDLESIGRKKYQVNW